MAVSFTKACLDYFGKRNGDTAMQFQAELKALSPEDREYFRQEFKKVGVDVEAATAPKG